MRQLGWQDHLFVVMESPRTPAHASYVSICDPSTSPKGHVTFDDVTDTFERRLPLVPTFRRRLVRVPLGLDQAYWLEDADFDLEYHLPRDRTPATGQLEAVLHPGGTPATAGLSISAGRRGSAR